MTAIYSSLASEPHADNLHGPFLDAKCGCGARAKAMWSGLCGELVFVCLHCATSVLPALIGDAIAATIIDNPGVPWSNTHQLVSRVERSLFRAMALAFERHHAYEAKVRAATQ